MSGIFLKLLNLSISASWLVLTVLALLPAVICLLCDWRINGRITWSGFAVGGLVLLYILAALPMAFAIIPNKALRERLGG